MSIVTSVLGKLQLIGAVWLKIASFGPKLTSIRGSAGSSNPKRSREWFSASHGDTFNNMQQARRSYNESFSKLPVAR